MRPYFAQGDRAHRSIVADVGLPANLGAIVTDLVGSPAELINDQGGIAWYHRTALWGRTLDQSRSGAYTPLRFPGQYADPESGLNYNFHRHYDPTTGRYGSGDPLGLAAGSNPHRYALNPHEVVDPLGLMTSTTTVYRVEGPGVPGTSGPPGNERISIDDQGNVSIPDPNRMLFLNFGNEQRADDYFQRRTEDPRFSNSQIKAFDVPSSYLEYLRNNSVVEANAGDNPGSPLSVDRRHSDQFGLRPAHIQELMGQIVPGSGRVVR